MVWLDGLNALGTYAWTVSGILILLVWGQWIVRWMIAGIFKESLTDTAYISLGMSGWVLPLSVWALLVFGGMSVFGAAAGKTISIFIIIISLPLLFRKAERISLPALGLILFFAASLVLRFAFLQKAILPLYFDSAEHYSIIRQLAETNAPPAGGAVRFYHVGYHLLSAAIINVFQLNIADVILVFGQVMLAVLPLPLFFIVEQETGSKIAGMFAVLLAGFGWHMPSHLVNWGKYPALLSLVCIHFVLCIGYLAYRNDQFKPQRKALYFLAGLGMLTSALAHTRSLIIFVILLVALLAAIWSRRLPLRFQYFAFGFVVLTLAIQIGFIWQSATLKPLLDGYLQNDIWMIALSIFLMLFSMRFFTELTFLLLTLLSLFLLGLFIPVQIPGYGMLTLLDRPYVQMLIYFPLSIIAGLGLAGLTQWIKRFIPRRNLPAHLMVFFTFGLVLLDASLHYGFYPSDCCQLVSRDDLAAFAWMEETLPEDANILAASAALYVTSFESPETRTGVDGGIWIAPLISRNVRLAWQALDFSQPETHTSLCLQDLNYIYAGGMPQSFDPDQLDVLPAMYQPVFALPDARVYQIIGCALP